MAPRREGWAFLATALTESRPRPNERRKDTHRVLPAWCEVCAAAVFARPKTDGDIRLRAGRLAARLAPAAIVVAGTFLLWTAITHHNTVGSVLSLAAALALAAGTFAIFVRREGWAFLATALTVVLAVFALFVTLFPNVMPSTLAAANSLTVHNASSTPYTLKVMTWVAVAFTPIVLAYQSWTYWVFRQRLTIERIPS